MLSQNHHQKRSQVFLRGNSMSKENFLVKVLLIELSLFKMYIKKSWTVFIHITEILLHRN